MIFHITTSSDWEAQKNSTNYFPVDFAREGFIHCCTKEQLQGVLDRYFSGQKNLVLLHLDEGKLKSELKYEVSTNDEKFPHIYGPINIESVVKVQSI